MINTIEEDDTLVLKHPTKQPKKALEEYKVDNVTDTDIDLKHVEKTEMADGDKVPIQRNIEKDKLQQAIEEGRAALLKDPLEVLYFAH